MPDLVRGARVTDERVARRDGVAGALVDVEAQRLAEQEVAVLGVAAAAAVAQHDVEVAVRTELQAAGVVPRLQLEDRADHYAGALRIGQVGVAGVDRVALDHGGAVGGAGVVHVELAVAGVAGVERQAEQALLGAGGDDLAAQVEERRRQDLPVADDADQAGALDREQPVVVAGGRGHVDRLTETGDDQARGQRLRGNDGGEQAGGDGESP